MRVVIEQKRRDVIMKAAMDAAFEVNNGEELSYFQEELIKLVVTAAVDKVEELLA